MKRKMLRKVLVTVVALVLMVAMSVTAFAAEPGPEGGWISTICLYGFTCNDSLVKSSSDTWEFVQIHAWGLDFAGYEYGYLYATPKKPSGTTMGGRTKCNDDVGARSYIYSSYEDYDTIRIRIDHPAPGTGNNMESKGMLWGYIE